MVHALDQLPILQWYFPIKNTLLWEPKGNTEIGSSLHSPGWPTYRIAIFVLAVTAISGFPEECFYQRTQWGFHWTCKYDCHLDTLNSSCQWTIRPRKELAFWPGWLTLGAMRSHGWCYTMSAEKWVWKPGDSLGHFLVGLYPAIIVIKQLQHLWPDKDTVLFSNIVCYLLNPVFICLYICLLLECKFHNAEDLYFVHLRT